MKIRIIVGKLTMDAELNDSPTARQVAAALPIEAPFHTWGDEIYFSVPVSSELDHTAKEEVEAGELGFWPSGKAFCIFFGPTPISRGERIVPASAVNIIGRVLGEANLFRGVKNESTIRLEPA
jgi:hypothetical protein